MLVYERSRRQKLRTKARQGKYMREEREERRGSREAERRDASHLAFIIGGVSWRVWWSLHTYGV